MDLQAIELVQGHRVDEVLDVLDRDEMPRRVDQQTAPSESWRVLDRDAGNDPGDSFDRLRREHLTRQQLPQRLDAVEQPGRAGGTNVETVRGDVQGVAFIPQLRLERSVQRQSDPSVAGYAMDNVQLEPHRRGQGLDQLSCLRVRRLRRRHLRRRRDAEDTAADLCRDGARYHRRRLREQAARETEAGQKADLNGAWIHENVSPESANGSRRSCVRGIVHSSGDQVTVLTVPWGAEGVRCRWLHAPPCRAARQRAEEGSEDGTDDDDAPQGLPQDCSRFDGGSGSADIVR